MGDWMQMSYSWLTSSLRMWFCYWGYYFKIPFKIIRSLLPKFQFKIDRSQIIKKHLSSLVTERNQYLCCFSSITRSEFDHHLLLSSYNLDEEPKVIEWKQELTIISILMSIIFSFTRHFHCSFILFSSPSSFSLLFLSFCIWFSSDWQPEELFNSYARARYKCMTMMLNNNSQSSQEEENVLIFYNHLNFLVCIRGCWGFMYSIPFLS